MPCVEFILARTRPSFIFKGSGAGSGWMRINGTARSQDPQQFSSAAPGRQRAEAAEGGTLPVC